jgi:hypothetical protein
VQIPSYVWTTGEGKHIKEREETRTSMVKEMEEAQACVRCGKVK